MKWSFILFTALLNACAVLDQSQYCDSLTESGAPVIKSAYYDGEFIRSQLVSINSKQGKFEFISQLEVRKESLILVAMTPIGQTLFQIIYKDGHIQFDAHGMPADFKPAYLLADLGLIYGHDAAIQECLLHTISGVQVKTLLPNKREFLLGASSIVIDYENRNQVGAEKITYVNTELDYRINIQTLEYERL
jgi:hypothetical protein